MNIYTAPLDAGVFIEKGYSQGGESLKSVWPKGILLDLDDTILAFDSVADASWNTVLARYGNRFGTTSVESVLLFIKSSARQFWSDPRRHRKGRLNLMGARQVIIHDALQKVGIMDDELVRRIAVEYDQVRTEAIQPIPGAIEAIDDMRINGVKLALVTNGAAASQREKINRFGLSQLFDCILIEGECGYGKPDERAYVKALSDLNVSANDAWMVGDNWEWEVVAPQRLGIHGIWVNGEDRPIPANSGVKPFRVVRSLAELKRDVV